MKLLTYKEKQFWIKLFNGIAVFIVVLTITILAVYVGIFIVALFDLVVNPCK